MTTFALNAARPELAWQQYGNNAKLGRLFTWVGSICGVCWLFTLLAPGHHVRPLDLTPSPIYMALAISGVLLLKMHAGALVPEPEVRLSTEPVLNWDLTSANDCKVLVVGPKGLLYDAFIDVLAGDGSANFQRIESPTSAFAHLQSLPADRLPHLLILSSFLPVISPLDWLELMRNNAALHSIPVIVWGENLQSNRVKELYRRGATSVISGTLNDEHLKAFRLFCQSRQSQ